MLLYADEVWRRTIIFFNIKRGSWIRIHKILFHIALIILEGTMSLAIILLLVQYRFQNHWSDGKHNAKVGQYIKVYRQQVNKNVRCFAIIVAQKNIWILFVTLIYLWSDLYFLCIFFSLSLVLLPSPGF